MRIKIILLFWLSLFISLDLMADVKFQNVNLSDIQQIKKRYPDYNQARPKLSVLDNIIRYLSSLDSYSSVLLEKLDGNYLITAIKMNTISDIQIIGNENISKDDILSALGLKRGLKIDSNRLMEAGEKLKEYYGRHGFFSTIVDFDLKEQPDHGLDISIKVTEKQPCLIKAITVLTDNSEIKEKLSSKVKKYLNKNFTESTTSSIESTMNEYLTDNDYLNSKVTQKEARYNFEKSAVELVYELSDSYKYDVIIRGTKYYNPMQVHSKVDLTQIAKGSFDPGQDFAQLIRNFYINLGFPEVKINYSYSINKKNFVKKVYIDVDEGHQVRIEELTVVGRLSRPAKYYSDFILKNSSDRIADHYLVREDLDNGFKNLTTELNNQGFLKAKIQSTRIDYNKERTKVKITTVLDEGPLTQLSKISFVGIKAFTEKQLLDQFSLKTNSPLRLNELEANITALKKFYYDRGYLEMKILNEDESLIEYDEKGLFASLTFKIYEGPQIYVKSILIEGNSFTKDYVILREINIDVGDLLTFDAIEEGRKRLDKLAIFSRVDLKTLEANTSLSQRTLVISVSERNPGLFKFGVGVTNKRDLTARGFAGLSYNNIAGTARAVSIRGTLENNLVKDHRLEYEFNLGYLEPFIFNQRVRGRANYTRSEQIPTSDENSLLATDSLNLVIERDLTSKIKFSWLAWGFDSVEEFAIPNSGPRVRQSRQEIAYIGPSLDIDYRDNPFLPTQGSYTKLDLEYASPQLGSSDKIGFVRSEGNVTHYLRLGTPKLIWANSVRGGYEKNLNQLEGSGIPISFAFFLGGYSTVRGYSGQSGDRIPGRTSTGDVYPSDSTSRSQLIVPGESTYFLLKSELRFPFWVEPFGGVIFYDAGRVDVQGISFDRPYKQSAGLGIRVNTPVGPISLDYARKIAPEPGESPDQWHLSIGTF